MQTLDRLLSDSLPSTYADRYADNWQQTSKATEEATGGYCCFPSCWTKGCEAHHAAYRDEDGPVAGRERPGVHVFWLCSKHHGTRSIDGAHHEDNWNKGMLPPPTLDAQQSTDYYLKLRNGFVEKRDWVERMKTEDPNYKFQTRSNGFKNRRGNKPCGRGKGGKQKKNSKIGSSIS